MPAAIFLQHGVAVLDGLQHFLFRGVLRARFHHDDAVFGARHHDIDLGFARFVVAGVGHQLAVHRTHAHAAQHMLERNVGDGQRRAGADNGQRAGIALRIGRQHHGDHLALVHEAFGEQRPDGPVNQPAGEDFLLRRASLALDEAAGKFARGVSVFTIIDGEGKERGVGLGFLIGARTHQNNGVPGADHDGAIGLFRDLARLQGNFLTIQVNLYGM